MNYTHYMVHVESHTKCQNKLHEDILQRMMKYSRLLVPAEDKEAIEKQIISEVKKAHHRHPRCKGIHYVNWWNPGYQNEAETQSLSLNGHTFVIVKLYGAVLNKEI